MDHHPAIDPMFRLCLKYQLPQAYVHDFCVHDMRELAELPHSVPFIWLLRENGTHIFSEGPIYSESIIANCFSYETRHFAVWDGRNFITYATPQSAIDAFNHALKLQKDLPLASPDRGDIHLPKIEETKS